MAKKMSIGVKVALISAAATISGGLITGGFGLIKKTSSTTDSSFKITTTNLDNSGMIGNAQTVKIDRSIKLAQTNSEVTVATTGNESPATLNSATTTGNNSPIFQNSPNSTFVVGDPEVKSKLDKLTEMASNMPQSYPDLSQDVIVRAEEKLKNSHSKNVMVVLVLGDSDKSSTRLANQINKIFFESGFKVLAKDPPNGKVIPAGLTMRIPIALMSDENLRDGLLEIFQQTRKATPDSHHFGVNLPETVDCILIIIGKN